MNPGGPVEEAGATARGFIDALKGQPAILALMVANFGLLLFIFYALHGAAKFREQLMTQVFQNTSRIHDMMQQQQTRSVPCPSGDLMPLKPLGGITVEPLKPFANAEGPAKPHAEDNSGGEPARPPDP
jgi:hypothetical protein